ncbi:MAG: PEP-CTERM sorting domain-containing protein [Methylovulum sp.]|nr:PEP-CTERM sorting domain-containing protein [Methylovulum sp.]
MKQNRFSIIMLWFFLSFFIMPYGYASIVIDNTNNGTNAFIGSKNFTNSTFVAKLFTTPTTRLHLTDMLLGLSSSGSAGAFTLNAKLYVTDGSHLPTGSALVSVSKSFSLGASGTGAYYDWSLVGGAFDAYHLLASTQYALVFSTSTSTAAKWLAATPTTYTAYQGFSFNGSAQSTDSGSTWGTLSNSGAFELSSSPIPEPSAFFLFGIGGLVLAWIRKAPGSKSTGSENWILGRVYKRLYRVR